MQCPKHNVIAEYSAEYEALIEYHTIYMVSKQEYDECKLNDIESKNPILKCDRPFENLKYTLYISRYSPVPDAIEFIPGKNYYFICKNKLCNPYRPMKFCFVLKNINRNECSKLHFWVTLDGRTGSIYDRAEKS